jgi:hypothetical protein
MSRVRTVKVVEAGSLNSLILPGINEEVCDIINSAQQDNDKQALEAKKRVAIELKRTGGVNEHIYIVSFIHLCSCWFEISEDQVRDTLRQVIDDKEKTMEKLTAINSRLLYLIKGRARLQEISCLALVLGPIMASIFIPIAIAFLLFIYMAPLALCVWFSESGKYVRDFTTLKNIHEDKYFPIQALKDYLFKFKRK